MMRTHPDWNVRRMYRAVLEEPERIELRLGLADLLEQTCETQEQSERAEFIRVQCEMATMEQPRELHGHDKYPGKALTLVPHGPNYWTTTLCGEYKVGDRIDAIANILFAEPKRRFHGLVISKILNFSEGEVVLKRDALSKPFPQKRYDALRRREAELLAATHEETCPRILLGGNDDHFCVSEDGLHHYCHLLERGGPDYFETDSALFSPVGSRVDVRIRNRKNGRWKYETVHGLLVRKVNRGEGELENRDANVNTFTLKRDELSVPGQNVMPISNAVRWAGKPGGREVCNPLFDEWHVTWRDRNPIHVRFWCGLPSIVRCMVEAWMGEECETCVHQSSRRGIRRCHACRGAGRINACGPELVATHPITLVECTDKSPTAWRDLSPIWCGNDDVSYVLPMELFRCLDRTKASTETTMPSNSYSTAEAANAALSDGLIRWARQRQPKESAT